jgi:hypothetical protein
VHIVVTCTNRKRQSVPGRLRLGTLPGGTVAGRCSQWIGRLGQQDLPSAVAARDLYCGEHWTIARHLPSLAREEETTHLWACSAGYGLIRAQAPIHPYAATFAAGHEDSVGEDPAGWWRRLGEWDGPEPGQPRTLQALAATDPDAVVMLILSAPYLRACRDDIGAAATALAEGDHLIVVSAGARQSSGAGEFTVPADARLQARLGGTLQALNVRIGEHLFSTGIRTRSEAAAHMTGLLSSQPPRPRFDRKKLEDDEVLVLIAEGLARSPEASASRLLREFRNQGYACEQSRFGQLHRRLTEATE